MRVGGGASSETRGEASSLPAHLFVLYLHRGEKLEAREKLLCRSL